MCSLGLKAHYKKKNLNQRFAKILCPIGTEVWVLLVFQSALLVSLASQMKPITALTLLHPDQGGQREEKPSFWGLKFEGGLEFSLENHIIWAPGVKLQGTFGQGNPQLQRPCPSAGRPRSWAESNGRQPRTEGAGWTFLLNDQWP